MKRPDWFLIGMGVAVALAWLLPDPGAKGGSLHPELANKLGVSLIFFLHGLTLSFAAMSAGTRNWRLHLLVQLSTFVLFPVLGLLMIVGLGKTISAGPAHRLVFLVRAALHGLLLRSAHRNRARQRAGRRIQRTLSSLLGVVVTPLWLGLVLGAAGHSPPARSRGARPGTLAGAAVVRRPSPASAVRRVGERHKARIGVLDRLTILLLVYTSFCDSVKAGVWHAGLAPLLISTLGSIVLLGLAPGLRQHAEPGPRLSRSPIA